MSKLTAMQEKFLEVLFHEEVMGDARKAMKIAGYSSQSDLNSVVGPLADEIFQRTQTVLAAASAAAAMRLANLAHDPSHLATTTHLDSLKQLLDRAGHVKKEQINVTTRGGGLFILPEKERIED